MDVAYEEEDSGLEPFDRMERRQMKTPRMNSDREEYELRDIPRLKNVDNRIGDGNMLFTDRSLNREYLDMVNEEKNRHLHKKSIFSSGAKRSPESQVNFEAICQE